MLKTQLTPIVLEDELGPQLCQHIHSLHSPHSLLSIGSWFHSDYFQSLTSCCTTWSIHFNFCLFFLISLYFSRCGHSCALSQQQCQRAADLSFDTTVTLTQWLVCCFSMFPKVHVYCTKISYPIQKYENNPDISWIGMLDILNISKSIFLCWKYFGKWKFIQKKNLNS